MRNSAQRRPWRQHPQQHRRVAAKTHLGPRSSQYRPLRKSRSHLARHLWAWLSRFLGLVILWFSILLRRLRDWLPQELGLACCILFTYLGVNNSTILLSANVLPVVFASVKPDLVISSALAIPLTALVFDARSYHRWQQSRQFPFVRRIVQVYCDGLLWPVWLSAPFFRRLASWTNRKRKKISQKTI
jgi:hypothetical protein